MSKNNPFLHEDNYEHNVKKYLTDYLDSYIRSSSIIGPTIPYLV